MTITDYISVLDKEYVTQAGYRASRGQIHSLLRQNDPLNP